MEQPHSPVSSETEPGVPIQAIGWNGISLQLPATWQPTVIYPDFLFFEADSRPAFEIKWQPAGSRFSLDKAMARLGRSSAGTEGDFSQWGPPKDLCDVLAPYSSKGFQLKQEKGYSHGILLHCRHCNRVTIVQWHGEFLQDGLPVRMMTSFKDHVDGQNQVWSLFDIRAILPAAAQLSSHEFLPGRYTLAFTLGSLSLTLYRFKPAALLLANASLGEFGTKLGHGPPSENTPTRAEWHSTATGLHRLLARLKRQPSWKWLRLWQQEEFNVILGVLAEGRPPPETGWLQEICGQYCALEPL